jgi:Sec-independent protein translocase protein TatA
VSPAWTRDLYTMEAVMVDALLKPQHLFIVLLIVLAVLNRNKLPELGTTLSEQMKDKK